MKLNPQFDKPEQYIGPGDYCVTGEDIVISTLLGSCIAVALYDLEKAIGGLNHFMLPFTRNLDAHKPEDSARYGINSMEMLINGLLKMGARREKFYAKVFGGSSVLRYQQEATYNIPKMNIEFIFNFLDIEKIPIESYSVGGPFPRKIYYFPRTAKVLMRYSKQDSSSIFSREFRYSNELYEKTKNVGKPLLFS